MNCILNGILLKKNLPEWKKFEFATTLKKGLNPNAFDWVPAGFPAIMITDTAPFRYIYYHTRYDTPDKIDYDCLARVVSGLVHMTVDLANASTKAKTRFPT